ncbi:MAG: DUF1064 domain-containing protein [Tannerellaceae bacterium]|nr:DUF1064 domain-containing protein [Tannerellaceae bacterium]
MNKFHAQKIDINGEIFDSKKEYRYFVKLDLCRKASTNSERVISIERQVRYDIHVNEKYIAFYKLDFRVKYADGKIRHIDIKGLKKGSAYQIFRLKKKLVEAIYGIQIEEI